MTKPTATIYQNENNVVVIFSSINDKNGKFRGAEISFENRWMDGAACGLAGFDNKKELDKFLIKNRFIKKGTLKLSDYCYSKHEKTDGATITCVFKKNHDGRHGSGKTSWKDGVQDA